MKKSIAFFQLIRFKNLLIIIGTQILIKYVLIPEFTATSNLLSFHFLLLVFSTITIAAAGYIINDIIDCEADFINKKSKLIIGTTISEKAAFKWYYILNLIGLSVGVYVSIILNRHVLMLFFIISISLLYAYSKWLKSIPLLGNVLVALLTAVSILIIGVFENINKNSEVFYVILTYSFFAFGINLIRELVKDIEDVNGDLKVGLKTLPILFGRKRANRFAFLLSSIFVISVVVLLLTIEKEAIILKIYLFIGILIPMLYFIFKLLTAKYKKDYSFMSGLLKGIMLLGMLTIFII
ncbi:MAG: geranylgeranylglycerol-phosphate geranylgeranyltransferase [Flavobacteriaceae bacterium]|nr:geranylgeranylglycerol-phosphate geranylgeranyltransferase [Flavobacteriaceae bacterium]